jgi:type II secretion system protein C
VKKSRNISDAERERVVDAALRNPECGPRRLARLVLKEGLSISESSICRILRHRNMHTREKRCAAIENMNSDESKPVAKPAASEQAGSQPENVGADETVIVTSVPRKRRGFIPSVFAGGSLVTWGMRIVQAVLFVMVVLAGFYTAQSFRAEGPDIDTFPSVAVANNSEAFKERNSGQANRNYEAVWKRDLFGSLKTKETAVPKAVTIESMARAPKELGLELVGTVVTGIAEFNLAIVKNAKTQVQESLHEGDRFGDYRVKKILRNNIIVIRNDREMLLAMEIGGTGPVYRHTIPSQAITQASTPEDTEDSFVVEIAAAIPDPPLQKQIRYKVARAPVFESLADPEAMENVRFIPQNQGDASLGYRFENLDYQNVFARFGLVATDVVQRINGEAVNSLDQAVQAIDRLRGGEGVEIEIVRGGEPWRIKVQIG